MQLPEDNVAIQLEGGEALVGSLDRTLYVLTVSLSITPSGDARDAPAEVSSTNN